MHGALTSDNTCHNKKLRVSQNPPQTEHHLKHKELFAIRENVLITLNGFHDIYREFKIGNTLSLYWESFGKLRKVRAGGEKNVDTKLVD